MNKAELVQIVAEKTGMTKKSAEAAVNAVTDTITESLVAGTSVKLVGFGTFEIRDRAERIARNPKTLEQIIVPATKAPVFRPGSVLKDAIV